MNLLGVYCGIVEANNDPRNVGRLKVRVPVVYGASTTGAGYIGTNDLPWAIPAGMPAGGSNASGGFSMLPVPGDQVMVQFLDGEPEKPVWQWLMQTTEQSEKLKLHEYSEGSDGQVGSPDRAILSRYGHSLEIKEQRVILTTSQGYQIVLQNSDGETGGSVSMQTPAGQSITANDLNQTFNIQGLDTAALSASNVFLNGASAVMLRAGGVMTIMAGSTLITIKESQIIIGTNTGASIVIDANGNIALVSAGGATASVENNGIQLAAPDGTSLNLQNTKLSVSATQVLLNSSAVAVGNDAQYPAVILSPSLLLWILSHTHTNGDNGSPTGPPIVTDPEFPQNCASARLRAS